MNGDTPDIKPPAPALTPPPNAVGRIKDAGGNITGYKLSDGSIWRGDTGAAAVSPAPPEGAVGRIKDASGNVTGYKLKDGSVWRPPPSPAQPPGMIGRAYNAVTGAVGDVAKSPTVRDFVRGLTQGDQAAEDLGGPSVSLYSRPSQVSGQYVQQKTAPYIGDEPSRLLGSTVSGAVGGAQMGGPYGAIPGAVAGLVGAGGEDLSMYVAPNHPNVAKAVGFAAPFALDLATPSLKSLAGGGSEISQKATTAAERAEVRATTAQSKAAQEAADATAKAQQAAATETTERAAEVSAAQTGIEQTRAKAEAEMPQKMAELRTQAEKDLAKQAQQEAFGREVGAGRPATDPEIIQREGQPPTTLPGQEEVARQAAFRNPMLDAINRSERELKLKRDAILAKRGTPAPTELQTPAAGEDPNALMNRLRGGTGTGPAVVAGKGAPRPTNMPVTAPPPPEPIMTSKGVPFKSSIEIAGAPQPPAAPTSRVYRLTPEGRAVPVETPPAAPTTGPATARSLVEPDYPPEMQGQVHEFRQGLGDPKLRALITDEGLSRNTMKYIMDNQQVGIQLANGLDEAGKGELRQGIADYYQNMGGGLDASHAPILKAAGFGKALSNPESWAYAERAQDHFATTIENAPAAKQILEQRMQAHFERLQAENDAGLVKEGLKWADKLPGGTGGRIRAAIEAAKTPAEKAQVVTDAYQHLQPETVPPPQAVAPRPTTDPQAAAHDAGVKFIMRAAKNKASGGMMGRLLERRAIYGSLGAAGGLVVGGRPGTGLAVAGLSLSALGIRNLLASSFRREIASPDGAERFFQAIQNPGINRNLNHIAGVLTETAVRQAVIQQGRQTPPIHMDIIKTPAEMRGESGPGPMSKAIEQKQAYAMASETRRIDPAHVQQVASLHGDISTGGTPNVQHDLSTGRLSQGEVRKMVEPSQPNAGQMFQGMQLADAMQAFGRGTDEEKSMALPLIAQKLNDEGRNLTPQQRRTYMAQLRQALPQEEGEAVG